MEIKNFGAMESGKSLMKLNWIAVDPLTLLFKVVVQVEDLEQVEKLSLYPRVKHSRLISNIYRRL